MGQDPEMSSSRSGQELSGSLAGLVSTPLRGGVWAGPGRGREPTTTEQAESAA